MLCILAVSSEYLKQQVMKPREFKTAIYNEMSQMTKALGNPHRLEILDLLAQGAASVAYISKNTTLTVANASQHLQVLRNAKLVVTERKGKYIYYRLTSQQVFNAWCALRKLGFSNNAEITRLLDDYRGKNEAFEIITAQELLKKMKRDDVVVLDVRPEEEYKRGHIEQALSFPQKNMHERMQELSRDKEIVAYCRGPLCLMADEAVDYLNKNGFKAKRLEHGFPEWENEGLPIEQ
jgi:rhodanese-related sulfurtransferase